MIPILQKGKQLKGRTPFHESEMLLIFWTTGMLVLFMMLRQLPHCNKLYMVSCIQVIDEALVMWRSEAYRGIQDNFMVIS